MPFAGYQDFDECVRDNQDKESPEGFCQWLESRAEGSKGMDDFRDIALTFSEKQGLTPAQIEGLCERFGGEEGFFTRCTESGGIQEAFDDPNKFCAWLKDQCHPGWREVTERAERSLGCSCGCKSLDEHMMKRAEKSTRLGPPEAVKNSGVMVALYPDATVAEALSLRSEAATPASDLHVTLAYLGDITELSMEALNALPHLVGEWASMAFPIEGRVSGVGRFANGEDIDPVYASVDAPGLHEVRQSLVSYLNMAGIPVRDDHGFTPHMTLQYVPAGERSPVDTVHPHPLRFDSVALAVAGNRQVYPLGNFANDSVELSVVGGPFFNSAEKGAEKEDGSEHIAYAAALVPGEPDSDGEVLNERDIERVAHLWMERYQNIDVMHTMNNIDVRPVESYITTQEMAVEVGGKATTLPAGTWVIAGKARDEEVWRGIKSGELAGYSVMAIPGVAIKSALKSEGDDDTQKASKARTLIRDLGPGWVVPFVSVVDRPAVPKARWFAFKSAFDGSEEDSLKGVPEESRSWVAAMLSEGKKVSEATYRQMMSAVAKMTAAENAEEDEMNEQEIRDLVQAEVGALKEEVSGLKSALGEKPLAEQIAEAVKEAAAASEPDGGKEGDSDGKDGKDGDDDSEAMKSLREEIDALKERAEKAEKSLEEKDEEYEAFKGDVESRLKTRVAKSRSMPGQDDDEEGREKHTAERGEIVTSGGLKFERDGLGRSVPVTK